MGITKLGNQNLSSNSIGSGEVDSGAVDTSKISATITNEDISPSANISATKVALPGPPSQFVRGDGSFGAIDTTGIDENAFNIGVLGFKIAVNEGLTVFNLVDGIVDEFHDNTGVDTPENSNAFLQLIEEISYKALAPIRKYIPSAGGLDVSPLVILIMINLLESFLTDILRAIV